MSKKRSKNVRKGRKKNNKNIQKRAIKNGIHVKKSKSDKNIGHKEKISVEKYKQNVDIFNFDPEKFAWWM